MTEVEVPTPDGNASATLHQPEGAGPWPAVIMFPDAGSTREVFRQMGDRLAEDGYVVLVPDVYYRDDYEPFDLGTAFSDPDERQRLGALMATLTPERINTDVTAYADFLDGLDTTTGALGTTGYCMGGRMSLMAAGYLGERVGAAAAFHGGGLAVADQPASPHNLAPDVQAVVYVGRAHNDASFDDEAAERLHKAYDAAGVEHTIDQYAAAHGYAVADMPSYDEAAAERHWGAMSSLFGSTLS
jgi:carboxymethylenebutenolidase